ncbi:MAG: putative sulfate exporter family transporter [Pseudomonadota bacterium]
MIITRLHDLWSGILWAGALALAAVLVARFLGGPVMLLALLFGMALTRVGQVPGMAAGLRFSSKAILKFGVALLGARIGVEDIAGLGIAPLVIVVIGVVATVVFGGVLARAMGLGAERGVLTGGATAICGASAALAIAAALPNREWKERETAFTVVAVTSLSTLAMVLYPVISRLLGFDDNTAGIFIGGAIHDVAQVVGAGYTISEEAGQSATLTKLFRVALLAPVVIAVAIIFRERTQTTGLKGLAPPPMLIGFIALAGLNSFGLLPPFVVMAATWLSTACLIMAVAAIGARTQIAELKALGWRPLALVVAETILLAIILLVGVVVFL